MKYYFAPMEGITGYVFRRVHRKYFPGIDSYYLPFIAAQKGRRLKSKESLDVSPGNNQGLRAVPQVLTKSAEDFIAAAGILRELGYREVNLNLGCPSPTVASKGKGAGMLRNPDVLDRFLSDIFEGLEDSGVKVSVKTRIGCETPEEAFSIFDVYRRYPISELIIHPRTLSEYYKGLPHRDVFYSLLGKCRAPAVYNGNIFSPEDLELLLKELPDCGGKLKAVMCGRGLLMNPALARELQGGPPLGLKELFAYQNEIYEGLKETLSGPVPPLSKMKELWSYMRVNFPEKERAYLRIKKARSFAEYEAAVREIFA
ncbi:MAG: tRNA-dihydrouridine synthase family protein [Bacteroidales bacterium]|nr:tRNA-dihydrouridine synthase family protein [Bacteroidales bacterium]